VPLRARLLLALVAVVAIGLCVSDVVVYAQLRSFLVERVDDQLHAATFTVSRVLAEDAGLPHTTPRSAPASSGTTTPTTVPVFPSGPFRLGNGRGTKAGQRSGLFPEGTVGELVDHAGHLEGHRVAFVYDGTAPPPPVLPDPLPALDGDGSVVLSAGSTGPHAVTYQVVIGPLHSDHHLDIVVAIPLTEVDQTMGRLELVMVLVSGVVLLGLGALAWWIVRRGLRPLEQMAATAAVIAEGNLGHRVAPTGDRTEIGRLGTALNSMLGEIETAFAARAASEAGLRRFLADASHELRTPLTSIRGYAELFEIGARDRPEDLATSMRHIREEADRMSVLVDDLLLLARLGRERPVEMEPVDVVPIVSRAVTAARASVPEHEVLSDVPAQALVLGDALRLRQVVDNLIANALRHSPDGSPVEVRVAADSTSVSVEVADRGLGVPPEEAARIFEPFYRSDSSRTRATGGAGLGLAIVAAIVGAHGGAVDVVPNQPAGARFRVRLPAAAGPRRTG
jgi:two-component system, OmpR family, sensor kinase